MTGNPSSKSALEALFNDMTVPSFALLSKSSPETVCATILIAHVSEELVCYSVHLNLGSVTHYLMKAP